MKQTFLNVRYTYLRNGEAVGFYRNISDAVVTADPTKLQIKTDLNKLIQANTAVDDAFNGVFSSKFTEQLLDLDDRRDNDLRGIRLGAKSALLNRDANVIKAGQIVLKWMDKYGKNIEGQPHRVETTIIRNMCDDATKPGELKDALVLLNFDKWVDAMNTTNNEFEKKFDERGSDVINNKSKISTSEAVLNARAAYEGLLKGIDARNTLDNTGKYTAIIDIINKIIKDTNTVVKAKSTTNKKAKAKKAAAKSTATK
jgi:Family of unknown function (DUF6261)